MSAEAKRQFSAGGFGSFSGPPAGLNTWGGDSRFTGPPLLGEAPLPAIGTPPDSVSGAMNYTGNTDTNDSLVSPGLSPTMLAKSPPTLLLTGTRAYDMSAAVQTQRELTKAGVETDLHLWDGMGHCFIFDADLPESKEAYGGDNQVLQSTPWKVCCEVGAAMLGQDSAQRRHSFRSQSIRHPHTTPLP